jgi:protein MpaA
MPPGTLARALGGAAAVALALGGVAAAPSGAAETTVPQKTLHQKTGHQKTGHQKTGHQKTVIGRSVDGRAITAYRLGDPSAARTVVAIGVLHGSERAPARSLRALRDGPPITGVDLWVVPVLNPDGATGHRRANAHGVDLNRNFPDDWVRRPNGVDAGARPGSEPETRAAMRFLDRVDPDLVVSFHQPLRAVDSTGTKDPALTRALARALRLPVRRVDCLGPCHGTLTGWFNARHDGMAVTVEFGPRPGAAYLTRTAPRGLLDVLS